MTTQLAKPDKFKPFKVNVSSHSGLCYTPNTVFASQAVKFRATKGQVLDVENFCSERETRKLDDFDTFMTEQFRAQSRAIGRCFDGAKLVQHPMLTQEDGAAFLNPLGAEGPQWLGYRDEKYWKLCCEVVKRATKVNSSSLMESAVRHLFTDYAANVSRASSIRKDGHMQMEKGAWSENVAAAFRSQYTKRLLGKFRAAGLNLARYCPSKNPTKSVGFNTIYPDGTPFDKKEHYYAPESLVYTTIPGHENESAWVRYDMTEFKDAWAEEVAKTGLPWWLENYKRIPLDPKVLVDALFHHMLDVHTEAYRMNNPDPFLNQIPTDWNLQPLLGKLYKKDRDVAYETAAGQCFYGLVDDGKYASELRRRVFERDHCRIFGTLLKKRPMFPADTASFSLPFIFLFRCFLKDIEDGPTALPSLSKAVLQGYTDYFAEIRNDGCACVLLDRRTCEQFMTDNFDAILSLFEEPLRSMLKAICTCVVPSTFGGRVVVGGCASGTAPTTFLNTTCGMFEVCNLMEAFFRSAGVESTGFTEAYVGALFDGHPFIKWHDYTVKVNMGTDDQVLYIARHGVSDDALSRELTTFLDKYGEKRFLKHEVGFGQSAFGLEFNRDHVKACDTLIFAKLFLLEKEANGDAAALKYWCRLNLLGDLHDAVVGAISDVVGGDVGSYELGARNYLRQISKFGFAVQLDELFNEHSPAEALAKGLMLEKLQYDPTDHHSHNYSVEQMEPIYNLLSSELLKENQNA